MVLKFKSKKLGKEVSLDQISELSESESDLLLDEAIIASNNISSNIEEITKEKEIKGIKTDPDWLAKTKRKKQICEIFIDKLTPEPDSESKDKLRNNYLQHLDKLIENEIGKERFESLKNEARKFTLGF